MLTRWTRWRGVAVLSVAWVLWSSLAGAQAAGFVLDRDPGESSRAVPWVVGLGGVVGPLPFAVGGRDAPGGAPLAEVDGAWTRWVNVVDLWRVEPIGGAGFAGPVRAYALDAGRRERDASPAARGAMKVVRLELDRDAGAARVADAWWLGADAVDARATRATALVVDEAERFAFVLDAGTGSLVVVDLFTRRAQRVLAGRLPAGPGWRLRLEEGGAWLVGVYTGVTSPGANTLPLDARRAWWVPVPAVTAPGWDDDAREAVVDRRPWSSVRVTLPRVAWGLEADAARTPVVADGRDPGGALRRDDGTPSGAAVTVDAGAARAPDNEVHDRDAPREARRPSGVPTLLAKRNTAATLNGVAVKPRVDDGFGFGLVALSRPGFDTSTVHGAHAAPVMLRPYLAPAAARWARAWWWAGVHEPAWATLAAESARLYSSHALDALPTLAPRRDDSRRAIDPETLADVPVRP